MKKLLPILMLFLMSCSEEKPTLDLAAIVASDIPALKTVFNHLEAHEVQIMLTDLNSGQEYSFQVADSNYFYPASTVKFPIAVLALEKIHSLPDVTSQTPYHIEGDSVTTTVRKDVEKIFAVSDNAAYNRLYEFLGTAYINTKLQEKGLQPARIAHRLSVPEADDPTTKALVFQVNDSTLFQQEATNNPLAQPLQLHRIKKGIGYYAEDELVNEPMNFSEKNYLPIATLHRTLERVIFPEKFEEAKRFQLDEEDHAFLVQTMGKLPRELGYDEANYYDSYVKFFLYGDSEERMPDHIRIHNKVGYAYGYLTDCAYVIDQKNDIAFMMTATIHVNENKVYNDDTYEYEEIGIPFLAALGQEVHRRLTP